MLQILGDVCVCVCVCVCIYMIGKGNGNPFQYSLLENPMGRGAWWATVHEITEESNVT